MPLSVLGLPRSSAEAEAMPRYVLDVRQCANCSHVFHTEFDPDRIPYRTGSNLVFNKAKFWQQYQVDLAREWIETYGLKGKRVVEIGCGEGLFLKPFLEAGTECVAFEPGPDAQKAASLGIKAYQEYFQAARLATLEPDALICRHVIEHMEDPLDFLQDIALASQDLVTAPLFLAEVPQIDKALMRNRMNDFLYEHVSNFTKQSFRTMFEMAGFEVLSTESRYHDEVVTIAARPRRNELAKKIKASTQEYRESVLRQITNVRTTLDTWARNNKKVALWGATGKGAALINMFGLTKERIPVVIDSDPLKEGGFVPGTGQRIRGPSYLKENPVDAILICTQWRARDIEHEIREEHKLDVELFVYTQEQITPLTASLAL
jgi:SAM-dependent methyltransferase